MGGKDGSAQTRGRIVFKARRNWRKPRWPESAGPQGVGGVGRGLGVSGAVPCRTLRSSLRKLALSVRAIGSHRSRNETPSRLGLEKTLTSRVQRTAWWEARWSGAGSRGCGPGRGDG